VSELTLSFKGKVLKIFPVLKGPMTLGSDSRCAIFIDSLAVQSEHAEIDTIDNNTVIRDLGTLEGTFIGTTKIEGVHTLKDGEVIRVGKHTLTYIYSEDINNTGEIDAIIESTIEKEAPPAKMETAEKTQGWLQIMTGANLGKTMSLSKAATNIGKPGVYTAIITKQKNGYFISQLEGKQPLLISNEELGDKSHPLTDGDTIQMGNIKMQFYLE